MKFRTAALVVSHTIVATSCEDRSTEPRTLAAPARPLLAAESSNSTWIRATWHTDDYNYVDCLDEQVHLFGNFPYSGHIVATASGSSVDHLKFPPQTPNNPPFLIVGQTSGKVFVYQNGGPFNLIVHLGPGQVVSLIDNESYKTADGESLTFTARIHVTENANGDVTISRDNEAFVCR